MQTRHETMLSVFALVSFSWVAATDARVLEDQSTISDQDQRTIIDLKLNQTIHCDQPSSASNPREIALWKKYVQFQLDRCTWDEPSTSDTTDSGFVFSMPHHDVRCIVEVDKLEIVARPQVLGSDFVELIDVSSVAHLKARGFEDVELKSSESVALSMVGFRKLTIEAKTPAGLDPARPVYSIRRWLRPHSNSVSLTCFGPVAVVQQQARHIEELASSIRVAK